jgi:hypothetical protein
MWSILKRYPIIWLAIAFIVIGLGILGFFFESLSSDFDLQYDGNIQMEETGQVGDFIGGVIGTIFTIAGTSLLVITLIIQIRTSEITNFETSFFELVKLHKENIAELSYSKYYDGTYATFNNRKAFQVLYKEFQECLNDVNKFTRHIEESEFLLKPHLDVLNQIIESKKLTINPFEFAKIDLAYTIFFFGLDSEGLLILKERFENKFKKELLFKLFYFLRLKPKMSETKKSTLAIWQKLRNKPKKDFFYIIDDLYHVRVKISNDMDRFVIQEPKTKNHPGNEIIDHFRSHKIGTKYYGGHQHRLSHYFRHLYQTYDFLDKIKFLNRTQKYQYGKTLRSQLSTYEQLILFCNSLSELGWKWELKNDQNSQLITDYKLIKNIPGARIKEIKPADIYPKLEFEKDKHSH